MKKHFLSLFLFLSILCMSSLTLYAAKGQDYHDYNFYSINFSKTNYMSARGIYTDLPVSNVVRVRSSTLETPISGIFAFSTFPFQYGTYNVDCSTFEQFQTDYFSNSAFAPWIGDSKSFNYNGATYYYAYFFGYNNLGDSYHYDTYTSYEINAVSGEKLTSFIEDYISDGRTDGMEGNTDIPETGDYDETIPTPKLVFASDGGFKFGINNASNDYKIEIQGRWYTVDNIELYRDMLTWKYKYSVYEKSDLTTWINLSDNVSSVGEHDLHTYGSEAFASLLSRYPVDDRTYYGGTNSIGNYFSGYNDALDTLKLLLASDTSVYNGAEIYIRFYYVDDADTIRYGKWCHWYNSLASASGSTGSALDDRDNVYGENQSEIGLTDDEKNDIESTDNSRGDPDSVKDVNGSLDGVVVDYDTLMDTVNGVRNFVGNVPQLFSGLFPFLPPWSIAFLIAVIVALAVIGLWRLFLGK